MWIAQSVIKELSVNLLKYKQIHYFTWPKAVYSSVHSMDSQATAPKKYTAFITRRLPEPAWKLLQSQSSNFNLIMRDSDEHITYKELLESVVGIDALLCLIPDKVDKQLIEHAGPNLKMISTMSVGTDHIDLVACKKHSIQVANTPGVLTDACADFTIGLLLCVSRRIAEGVARAKKGDWPPWHPLWMCGPSLSGSTVGIVGLGQIGQAVAKRLMGFGVGKILYVATTPKPEFEKALSILEKTDLSTLLANSDFILTLCPLTSETRNLFDKNVFSQMKSTAIFINVSRGPVVNQDDLYEALVNKKILAAGIDVTTPEPLPPSHPLYQLDNCVITPHIASAEFDSRNSLAILAVNNLLDGLNKGVMQTSIDLSHL